MKNQPRPSLLALSALLLCTLQQTHGSHRSSSASSLSSSSSSSSSSTSTLPASSSEVSGRDNVGTSQNRLRQTDIGSAGNQSPESRSSPKLQEVPAPGRSFSSNTSRGNISTVIPERAPSWSPVGRVSSLCAYRVIEGGIGGQLCFRQALRGYRCPKGGCRAVVSTGNLVANILTNGSVLLQWSQEEEGTPGDRDLEAKLTEAGAHSRTNSTNTVISGRRHKRGGFELSCWWNGSYTQFECAGVHLGPDCTDFLLAELHENIPYKLCLRPLERRAAEPRHCVEFTLPPSGMQDIVIAMTTVGGAICVMLVIICLLVAYITENIMSPTTQHSYSYRTHSRH